MPPEAFLYTQSSITITAVLFLLILLFNEIGFRAGRFVQGHTNTEIKALTGSIQASILGLLALLLGFTFNLSMQRYDQRNFALIEEANAIGTALLRAELLPERQRDAALERLREYVELRIAVGEIDLTRQADRARYLDEAAALQRALWLLAVSAAQDDPRPVTSGAFIAALNELIDTQGKRNALLQMHVPEIVLFLLFVVFIASGGILGYSSGLGGTRVVAPAALVSFLIALVVFLIIDLDRPRRGLIQVDRSIMLELRAPTPDSRATP